MKRFTVVCHRTVEDQLGELILAHWGTPLMEQVTSAANRIDAELAMRADEAGTKIETGLRTLVVYPLAVEFEVNTDDRMVTILGYELARVDSP